MQGHDSTADVGGVPLIHANVPRYNPSKRKRGERGKDVKARKQSESPHTSGAKEAALQDNRQGYMGDYFNRAIRATIPRHRMEQH